MNVLIVRACRIAKVLSERQVEHLWNGILRTGVVVELNHAAAGTKVEIPCGRVARAYIFEVQAWDHFHEIIIVRKMRFTGHGRIKNDRLEIGRVRIEGQGINQRIHTIEHDGIWI